MLLPQTVAMRTLEVTDPRFPRFPKEDSTAANCGARSAGKGRYPEATQESLHV